MQPQRRATFHAQLFVCDLRKNTLHDLILSQAASVLGAFHDIAIAQVRVLDVGKTERPTTVLVASELGCRRVSDVSISVLLVTYQ
jgi:hypothetical protein